MTTEASTPAVNGSNDAERDPNADHSPSRFTAVNGREPPGPSAPTPAVSHEQQREGFENWRGSGYSTPSQQDIRLQESDGPGNDRGAMPPQPSPSQYEPSMANGVKRKRSESEERGHASRPSHQPPGASAAALPRLIDSGDPRGLSPNSSAAAVSQGGHQTNHASSSDNPRPVGDSDPRNLSIDTSWQEHSSHLVNRPQHAPPVDSSDAHVADVLQRGAHNTDQMNLNASQSAADVPFRGDESLSAYGPERPQRAAPTPHTRKRGFTNRTKTGCLTCRRRKKKCDEQRPVCNNCQRGGFECKGYLPNGSGQRPPNSRMAVPLQSAEGHPVPDNQPAYDLNQQHAGQRGLPDRPGIGTAQPTVPDEAGHVTSQYSAKPTDGVSNHGPWINRNWPSPSLSDPRGNHPRADYPVVPPLREPPYVSNPRPGAPLLQGGIHGRAVHASNVDSNSPQAQARMALSIENQLSSRAVSNDETEKDKMLRGDLYQPFDIHLVEERTRCKAALWRFNNACNGISGSSTREQSRLLKEVLVPPSNSTTGSPSGVATPHSGGSMGQGAIVLAPFECHYGYNIHIGEDVMISEACRFVDDCSISIGAHTWLGPAVTILTSMAHPNMQERRGSQSRYQGRPVTIEEDCYIGANCTIYPGVRIRRGVYVAPGEVIRSDIAAYGFQGLMPTFM